VARGRLDLPIVSKFDQTGLQKAKDAFGGFGKQLAGIAAGIAAAFSVRAIARFATESVKVAEAAATAQARLEAVASATGIFGDQTDAVTKRLADFAKQQEMRIAVDDKVIKGVQAQLLSFKALGASADETGGAFDRATAAAFDMAAAGFGSAEGNAVALGKALENPIKGVTALARSGTTFTDAQREQIKVLQESGDLLGAQELILAEVESQYGGVAAATANASDKLAIAFENIKETAGEALLPIFADLVENLLPVLDEIGVAVADAFTELGPVLQEIAGHIPGLVRAFLPLIPTIGALAGLFLEIVAMVLPLFVELMDKLLPIIMELAPIIADVFVSALQELFPVFMALIDALLPIVEALLPVILDLIIALAPVLVTLIQAFLPLIKLVLPILIETLNILIPIIVYVAELFAKILIGAIDLLIGGVTWLTENFETFASFFENTWKGIANFFIGIINSMLGVFEGFINYVIGGINSLINALNRLKVSVPAIGRNKGFTLGFNIPNIPTVALPRIPELAEGGIVNQATLALIGEAGPEAVIPLDQLDSGGVIYNITVNAGLGTNGADVWPANRGCNQAL
jgi:phage-related protein